MEDFRGEIRPCHGNHVGLLVSFTAWPLTQARTKSSGSQVHYKEGGTPSELDHPNRI